MYQLIFSIVLCITNSTCNRIDIGITEPPLRIYKLKEIN